MKVLSHKDLEVWQRSMNLVADVYLLTKTFPKEELYGLVSQMRRAAVSIPSNIAEGRAKRSTRDYIRFVNIAYGSAAELETQMLIAKRLEFAVSERSDAILSELSEIGKMLNGLLLSLEKKISSLTPES